MSIGTGVVLFVIGAILAFAVNISVDVVNLHLIGYILMIAGAITFVVGIALLTMRLRSTSVSRTSVDPAAGEAVTSRSTDSVL